MFGPVPGTPRSPATFLQALPGLGLTPLLAALFTFFPNGSRGLTSATAEEPARSAWRIVDQAPLADGRDKSRLAVRIRPRHEPGEPLPVRAIVTAGDGTHRDGSGHGTYSDGRFFADGSFAVEVLPGKTAIELHSGPNYVPLAFAVDLPEGKETTIEATLERWFHPEARGWYGGDNHVHAQHDAAAEVETSLAYTALQARANGLSFITEAGSNVSYADLEALNSDRFVLRTAPEIRPGPFVGHFNTPGLPRPIPRHRYEELIRRPLPGQAVGQEVRRLGGLLIHSHPLSPPYQAHWMGATEVYSDAVLGDCADLFDVDSEAAQQLWFAVLNLGNRVGVSSYTDAALGRKRTLSPGDRRVYCQAKRLDYDAFVDAMRQHRTIATNGGPLFAFLEVDGRGPGEELTLAGTKSATIKVEVQSLHPLRSVTLFERGRERSRFNVPGRKGTVTFETQVDMEASDSWFVLRADDEENNWCLTSPVYVTARERRAEKNPGLTPASRMVLLQISNAERFIKLRREFFAHVIATVSPEQEIERVELLRDKGVIRAFDPAEGNELHEGRIPVTEMPGRYGPGWIWHPNVDSARHFQADWPVTESGWYRVRLTTTDGTPFLSDAVYFDAENPKSHQLSAVRLEGGTTRLTLHGYSEEMPLSQITEPFEGDHWWYPQNTYWHLRTDFAGSVTDHGYRHDKGAKRFSNPEP